MAYDYRAGVDVNLEMDKVVIATLGENVTQGKMRVIFEDSKFLCMERTFKSMRTGEPLFSIGIFTVTYLNGLIITAESAIENYVQDPSEGQDWNWEDYEWLDWGVLDLFRVADGFILALKNLCSD